MKAVLSRAELRAFERRSSEERGISELILMENAGRGAAERLHTWLGPRSARVLVVCGGGNNAGDGFVVARRLLVLGHRPLVVLLTGADRLSDAARANFDGYLGLGGAVLVACREEQLPDLEREITGADCVVDAIFGIGLDREISGHFGVAIDLINRSASAHSISAAASPRVVALDIASGLDADSGRVLGTAVRAHATVTFGAHKLGMFTPLGAACSGKIVLADIGVPAPSGAGEVSARLLEAADVLTTLPRRAESMHKGDAGRIVVFAGSPGKVGAALLVGRAALRAGGGLVTLASFEEVTRVFDSRVLELMTSSIDSGHVADSVKRICQHADSVVVGPGLGLSAQARAVVEAVLFGFDGPKVIDADGLTHLAGRLAEIKSAPGSVILTPHAAEMGRLLGASSEDVEAERWAALAQAVTLSGAVVVLKGARTLVGAPGESPCVNVSPAPALATAGSGDVLGGMIAALAATLPPFSAATSAVFLHGRAGEAWQRRAHTDRGLLAHEIADLVPDVIAELTRSSEIVPD